MKNKKYVTVGKDINCLDYRTIAEIMTKEGHKMNHSSVRNYIVRGFTKIVKNMSDEYNLNYSSEKIDEIAKSPEFQHSLIEVMSKNEFNKL